MRLEEYFLLKESFRVDLDRELFKSQSDEFVISLLQEVLSIFISELNELQLSKNLRVDNSELVIDGLVEDHVVDMLIQWVTNHSKSSNTVLDYGFHELIDLLWKVLHFSY